ncbi:MAG: hypothetical protein ABSB42_13565 [Tepidisphaeraceae bacterium]
MSNSSAVIGLVDVVVITTANHPVRLLRAGSDERLLGFGRKIDRDEPVRWIEIIFSFFVDNAKEIWPVIRLGLDNLVGHSELQRSFILPALNANREKWVRSFTAITSG